MHVDRQTQWGISSVVGRGGVREGSGRGRGLRRWMGPGSLPWSTCGVTGTWSLCVMLEAIL